MDQDLHQSFINKLEEKYGEWETNTSIFGRTSFGEIADDLCISKSQFTMLISGKGTDGMYIRSIKNVQQLIEYDNQKTEIQELKQSANSKLPVLIGGLLGLIGLAALLFNLLNSNQDTLTESDPSVHPLLHYFEGNFRDAYVAPFLKQTEVQSYCPASAYEGSWELAQEYIIPLPSRRPGLYYIAKSADVRMKCLKGVPDSLKGKKLIAFENIHNELWLDLNRTPFSPKYFDKESLSYTAEFNKLNFAENEDFVKVADIYSCFFDQFTITKDRILRRGEPCGRIAKNIDQKIVDQYEIDVEYILEDVISSMAQIECQPAINKYCNPNDLKENSSTINYECMFGIKMENLGIGGGYPYQKVYKLAKQNYSDNLLCNCE